jgi:hypothetical protein
VALSMLGVPQVTGSQDAPGGNELEPAPGNGGPALASVSQLHSLHHEGRIFKAESAASMSEDCHGHFALMVCKPNGASEELCNKLHLQPPRLMINTTGEILSPPWTPCVRHKPGVCSEVCKTHEAFCKHQPRRWSMKSGRVLKMRSYAVSTADGLVWCDDRPCPCARCCPWHRHNVF